MSLLSWNCRGLGNLQAVQDLCWLVKDKRPTLIFLMETKLPSHSLEIIKVKTGYGSIFVVDSVGRSGGLALMWSDKTRVEIQNYS
jgi:exonuclease III